MTSFYNTNCISNCFPLSTALLSSPRCPWAVLGFMKSGLSHMKFKRGLEGGSHISCLAVFLCSEAWALAGRQRIRVHRAMQKGRDWLLPPLPQRSGSQGSIKDSSWRWVSFNCSAKQVSASISHLESLSPFPSSQAAPCVSTQQKAHWCFIFKVCKLIFRFSDQ